MNPNSAASAYQEATLESAPPIKILRLLYEGALRFLAQAQALDPVADADGFGQKLRRADAIVCELRLNLDHEVAPELSRNLTSLYLFVEEQIQEALIGQTATPIAGAKTVLKTLHEGWNEVEAPTLPAAG